MADVSSILKQLKAERDRVAKQLAGMDAALTAFAHVYNGTGGNRRKMSAKSRAKIAAAQRRRWAKFRAKA
jgi:Skp family chaperone for outer membrane proteins